MNQKQAFAEGRDRAHSIGSWAHLPLLGSRCVDKPEGFDDDILTTDNIEAWFAACIYEAESVSRQTADFAALAYEFNSVSEDRMEGLWEAYERGLECGIRKVWRARKAYYELPESRGPARA
jgi:hypothetical protein